MSQRIEEIYDIDGHENSNIIAIDAALTDIAGDKNTVIFKEGLGVKPGAGMGKKFPVIGDNSILLFTLHKSELTYTLNQYKKGYYVGKRKDLCDISHMKKCAVTIADMIAEIYHDVCNREQKHEILN